jgi:hypothetical protein
MRFDTLKQDTLYFREHFPEPNYNSINYHSMVRSPDELEIFLEKIWTKDSGIEGNFFEALAWIRSEDYVEYDNFRAFSRNEHDTEYTYDSIRFQDWVLDDHDTFCIYRHASAVYNLPYRIVQKMNMYSIDKYRQADYVLKFIHDYENKEQKA